MSGVLETSWLCTIDSLGQSAMKEGILHVKLVDRLGTRSSKAEDDAYRGRLHDGAECFVVVDAVALREAVNHPTYLVAGKGTIQVEFVFKNPLARHNIGARRTKDEAPCTCQP